MLQRKSVWLVSFICLILLGSGNYARAQMWNPSHAVGTVSGNNYYQNGQTPDQLVELRPATLVNALLTFQWYSSTTPVEENFQPVANATQSSYSPGPLLQTTYYRRKTTYAGSGAFVLSNIVKLSVVSANWENRNYIREYTVQVSGVTSVLAVDQLPMGQKLQSTTYVDGLGRTVQQINRETATPAQAGGAWGDQVQFSTYDEYGRRTTGYLPYTTNTQLGKFKTDPLTEQQQYYSRVYNETAAFSSVVFENNPLNRVKTSKSPGTVWAASAGHNSLYDINQTADDVKLFSVDFVKGNAPVLAGAYNPAALYKAVYTDEYGKQVVEYTNNEGLLLLKKIQEQDVPSASYDGWLCTYYIYDKLNQLRFLIQPEGVRYLAAHSWSFAGTQGQQVLDGYCFQYFYDAQGRTIWKKVPGAEPMNMLYNARDQLILAQDGNQAKMSTPQWTLNLYDDLGRLAISALYNTTRSITQLQADIDNGVTISTTIHRSPVSPADLNNPGITTILKYLYYDDYSFPDAKPFNTGFTNTTAYNNSDPNVLPIVPSQRTLEMPTGSKMRVLGTNTFLTSTRFYDEKGQLIQTQEENIKGGTDILTRQFHFDGRQLSSCYSHTAPGTNYSNFITLNKYNFDQIGRVTSTEKQVGSNTSRKVSSLEYDDMGRIKTKNIDPDYITPARTGLEKLDYSFNLNNQLIGINKDYALKNPANYDKWGHFFGMYLGYDNRDNVFNNSRLNGQVAGVVWNTQGDDAQRKYDYSYDNVGRLMRADFTEQVHPGDGWSNTKMDFSVSGSTGKIIYDANGNLVDMLQRGVQPGNATPIDIDKLVYSYQFSNKLQSVTDNMANTSVNGQFGDFKDGSNGSVPDYVYDYNGNLVIDLNKNAKELGNVVNANGIHYNYMDKPDEIRIAGKGTIKIVYSAGGEKLQRTYTPENGGDAVTTTYIENFVYEKKGNNPEDLAYIENADGRIRVIQPVNQMTPDGMDGLSINGNITLPGGKAGVYDYTIMDYQQNVRMVLTEEAHVAFNTCSMESSRSTAEEPVFGQAGGANEVVLTRAGTPQGWKSTNTSDYVSELGNIAGHNIGPNTLQKVMAGDQVTASALYYYNNNTGGSNPGFVSSLLTSLGQAIIGGGAASSVVKANMPAVTSGLNGTYGFTSAVQPTPGVNAPQAYLTILFFDERFKFIDAVDGGVAQLPVSTSGGPGTLGLGNIKAPRNGYVYVYVSNQSDQSVYFDDFKVSINRGNIIEENHYYSYGLKIAAISSRKAGDVNEGKLKNDYLYNGNEFFDDADLNWYDYGFRNYDPQIGRFVQVDPIADEMPGLSGYHYAYNDPVTNVDAEGLIGEIFCWGTSAFTIFMTHAAEATVNVLTTAATAINILNVTATVSNTYTLVQQSVKTSSLINGELTTLTVGGPPTKTAPDRGPSNWSVNRRGKLYDRTKPSGWSTLFRFIRSVGKPIAGTIILTLTPSNAFDDPADHPENRWLEDKLERELEELEAKDEDLFEKEHPDVGVRYVTYTKKKHNEDGTTSIYSGRTHGPATMTALQIMEERDKRHEVQGKGKKDGYDPAVLDEQSDTKKNPFAKFAIRGREQQLIDHNGGAQKDRANYPGGGTSANIIRGVRRDNPMGRIYHNASNITFKGEYHKYTGL